MGVLESSEGEGGHGSNRGGKKGIGDEKEKGIEGLRFEAAKKKSTMLASSSSAKKWGG